MSGEPTRIELVADAAALRELRDEWNELLRGSDADSLFLSWEWLASWWTHLGAGRKLAIAAVRRRERLLALAPLAARRTGLGERLELLGTGRAGSDYLDVIVRRDEEPAGLRALARHLLSTRAVLELKQLRSSSAARQLALSLGERGYAIREAAGPRCPFIDLRGHSFESYLATLGAEHRYAFRRKQRRLETQQRVRFEEVRSEERRRELLPVLFELHRRRWDERGGSDGLEGPGILPFHEDVSRLALARGWLRLFVLWLGGEPAAALYGFRYGQVFSFYQAGFDPRFAKLGVGTVALGLAIESAIREGAAEFDLLHGEEPYKFHWAKQTRALSSLSAYPASAHGRLAWGGAVARDAARVLRDHAAAAR